LGRDASNRPNTTAGGRPSGRRASSSRSKWRCSVRWDGDHPECDRRIRSICAAGRIGFSRFNPAASSSTCSGVRAATRRRGGINASNPPARQARIHRSTLARDTRAGSPNGPVCPASASRRTSRPRCLVDNPASAASRIS
jgi:hypothetical protein